MDLREFFRRRKAENALSADAEVTEIVSVIDSRRLTSESMV